MSILKKVSLIFVCLIMLICVFVACNDIENNHVETSSEISTQTSVETTVESSEQTSVETNSEYTITYDANGGTMINTAQTVTYGDDYTLAVPERTGYTFNGWYDGDVKYESGVWNDKNDVMLTASWSVISYEISYVNIYGVNDNAEIYTVEDEIALSKPDRVGYTFIGWTYEGQNTPVIDVTIAIGTVGNKEYIANWQANSYTITYDANNGILLRGEQSVEYDSEYTLEIPVREGYVFSGWYNGTTKYTDGVWSNTSDVALKADWKPISWIGNAVNSSKIKEDIENKTVELRQMNLNQDYPTANFFFDGEAYSEHREYTLRYYQ